MKTILILVLFSSLNRILLSAEIDDSWYFIKSKADEVNHLDFCLDVIGGDTTPKSRVGHATRNDPQVWRFIPAGNDSYYIVSHVSGLDLQTLDDIPKEGGGVFHNTRDQRQSWKLIPDGNGYYYIKSNVTNLNLDVAGGNVRDGGPVCQASQSREQAWKLIKKDTPTRTVLTRAELKTLTPRQKEGDNKDHDTGVFAVVTSKDKLKLFAQIDNADADVEYGDENTYHIIPLKLSNKNIEKSECNNFAFAMGILARGGLNFGGIQFTMKDVNKDFKINIMDPIKGGNDRWFFHAWLVLYFSDGTIIEANKFDQSLESSEGNISWNNLQ